jgi:Dyp-type peroxidase family
MATENLQLLEKHELPHIQGLIISGYGHLNYAAYVFLSIGDIDKARNWLSGMAPKITTADWSGTDGQKKKPPCAINIAFTGSGIRKFNMKLNSDFSQEFNEGISEPHRSRRLGDDGGSAPDLWEIKEKDVDVLLIIQGSTDDDLQETYNDLKSIYTKFDIKETAPIQFGKQPENKKEHFGFADGISQPFIENSPANTKEKQLCVKAGEFILGYKILPPLFEDDSLRDFGKNGSYFVFRKLYQDVAGFNAYLDANTNNEEHRTMVAAKFVGRWPNGTPLVLSDKIEQHTDDRNDFGFVPGDIEGMKCPIGAHIRRSNPRDSFGDDPVQSIVSVNRHRLLRRGIQYGKPLLTKTDDGVDRGILFFCVNADIKRQFEFVQQTWINNQKFADLYSDRDPICGNNKDPLNDNEAMEYNMTIPSETVRERLKGIPRFVKVKGGAYFFMPSIPALNYLAEG